MCGNESRDLLLQECGELACNIGTQSCWALLGELRKARKKGKVSGGRGREGRMILVHDDGGMVGFGLAREDGFCSPSGTSSSALAHFLLCSPPLNLIHYRGKPGRIFVAPQMHLFPIVPVSQFSIIPAFQYSSFPPFQHPTFPDALRRGWCWS